MKIRWRVEGPLIAALFLDLLGFGMILADFQLRGEAMMPAGWPTGFVIGSMLASTFLIQILVSPRWGLVSDRIGRKPVLVACSLLSALAMLIYGFAGSIWILLLSRLVAGFGGANVAIAQALIADEMDEDERTNAIGRLGAAISSGLIVGPVVGGFLAIQGGNFLVGITGGVASLVGALLIFAFIPNPAPKEAGPIESQPIFQLRILREFPRLVPLVAIASVSWFAISMLEGTFARLINALYGYDQREFGLLFGYEALVGVIIQGVALVWIRARMKDRPLLRIAYILQGVGLLLNPLAVFVPAAVTPLMVLFLASTLFAVGVGIASPTLNSACSRLTPKARQGELFGLLQASRSVGFLVGPLLGGILFDWQPAAPYVIAFLVCLTAAALVPAVSSPEAVA